MRNLLDIGQEKKKQHLNHGVSEQHWQKRKEKYLKDNETLYIYNYIAIIAGLVNSLHINF